MTRMMSAMLAIKAIPEFKKVTGIDVVKVKAARDAKIRRKNILSCIDNNRQSSKEISVRSGINLTAVAKDLITLFNGNYIKRVKGKHLTSDGIAKIKWLYYIK